MNENENNDWTALHTAAAAAVAATAEAAAAGYAKILNENLVRRLMKKRRQRSDDGEHKMPATDDLFQFQLKDSA